MVEVIEAFFDVDHRRGMSIEQVADAFGDSAMQGVMPMAMIVSLADDPGDDVDPGDVRWMIAVTIPSLAALDVIRSNGWEPVAVTRNGYPIDA